MLTPMKGEDEITPSKLLEEITALRADIQALPDRIVSAASKEIVAARVGGWLNKLAAHFAPMNRNMPIECAARLFYYGATVINNALLFCILFMGQNASFGVEIRDGV